MKILRLAQYVNNNYYPEFKHNISGYSRSVWDISRFSASSGNEEYLFTFSNKKSRNIENVFFIDGRYQKMIKYADIDSFKFLQYLVANTKELKSGGFRAILSKMKYAISIGYLKKIIKEINPEVIHIHGLTLNTHPFIQAVKSFNIPVVVTLHGLNMEISPNQLEREYEINMISKLNHEGIPITVIGSGMLNTIRKHCDINDMNILIPINHGIDPVNFDFSLNNSQLRRDLSVDEKKVILSVGSISERRNQIALVRAISLMDQKTLMNIKVFIIGDGIEKNNLKKLINKKKLEKVISLEGYKNSKELSKYYSIADVTAVLSKVEGFGRPILESFLFGVPVIAFEDLDAVRDLEGNDSLYLIEDREDESIKKMILKVLSSEINHETIVEHSKGKTWETAIEKYNRIYDEYVTKFKGNSKVLVNE